MFLKLASFFYKKIARPVFFLFDPEAIHNFTTSIGAVLGDISEINKPISSLFGSKSKVLKQKIAGITFESPVGLAAGFDYEAKFVKILPSLGFGFNTVGTITNYEYGGNPKPRLGRLIKSKSLMINKGFKNKGAIWTAEKLANQTFKVPLGISIGKSNIKQIDTQEDAILDAVMAFKIFENSNVANSYYELNISCPNLYGNITFYVQKNLDELLTAVDKLNLKKPIFIKMPISLTNKQTVDILDIIVLHKIAGVIIGNVQTNRNDKSLDKNEVKKWKIGNFSGKPTWKRSNELIRLAYQGYGKKLVIIGCGGVFETRDAYTKIKLGASLVQLITGLIYEGPTLVSEINSGLPRLLKKDGYKNISEAIGVDN